jgi:hypothetical protein
MQSQTESDPEEGINKNERATGILFGEESYEALQTKITPARNQAAKPPIPVFMAFHPSADILLILSTPQVTFLLLSFNLFSVFTEFNLEKQKVS